MSATTSKQYRAVVLRRRRCRRVVQIDDDPPVRRQIGKRKRSGGAPAHVQVDREEFTQFVLDGVGERELADYFNCTIPHVKYLKDTLNLTTRRAPRVDFQLPDADALSEM